MQQLLKIWWSDEIEFVAFDEDYSFPCSMKTTERWDDHTEVTYEVKAEFKKNNRSRRLNLTYKRENQTDPNVTRQPRGAVRYGTSTITWNSGHAAGTAQWSDDEKNAVWNGEAEVSVLGGREIDISDRARRSVLVAPRPQQTEFRNALLHLDKQCALTGETCPEALQAAHLIPVSGHGQEQIENGILLRADLHSLLDAGLICFEVSDNRATVKCCSGNSLERYAKCLDGKPLPKDVFQRVRTALEARAKLPGGRGRTSN
jgi:hypothetical protein